MPELEDLKLGWQQLEHRVAKQLELQNSLHQRDWKERQIGRARRSLWPLFIGQIALMMFGIAMIVLGVAYWTQHREFSHRFLAGVAIHVYGVCTVIAGGSTLGLMRRIDYSQSIMVIQQRVAILRAWYIGTGAAIGLVWWFLWIPFMQVVFGLLGADMMSNLSTGFLAINALVGVLGLFGTWLFHRWLTQPGRESLAVKFSDGAAGKSLTKVQGILEELSKDDSPNEKRP